MENQIKIDVAYRIQKIFANNFTTFVFSGENLKKIKDMKISSVSITLHSKHFSNSTNKRSYYKKHFPRLSSLIEDAISAFISSAHDFLNKLGTSFPSLIGCSYSEFEILQNTGIFVHEEF